MADYTGTASGADIDKIAGLQSSASEIDGLGIRTNTFVIDGDSIAAQCKIVLGDTTYSSSSSWYEWANIFSKGSMALVDVNGAGGERTDQLLARIDATATTDASYAVIMCGTNDIAQDIVASVIIDNLMEIYNTLLNAGKVVVACTLIPRDTVDTADRLEATEAVNGWIKSLPLTHKNIVVCDFWSHVGDVSNGLAITDMTIDGVHPSIVGAYHMGVALHDAMKPFIQINDVFPSAGLLIGNQLVENPFLTDGASDTATGWTINDAVSVGTVQRTNGMVWKEIGLDSANTLSMYRYTSTNFSVGDTIRGMAEIEVDNITDLDRVSVVLYFKSDTETLNTVFAILITSATTIRFPNESFSGVMTTPNFDVPTGCTRILFQILANMTGTIRVGRTSALKVV